MASKKDAPPAPAAGTEATYSLSKLLLDKDNARFGLPVPASASQADILDRIVEKFGVDDVLSSLAVNGYFELSPWFVGALPGATWPRWSKAIAA